MTSVHAEGGVPDRKKTAVVDMILIRLDHDQRYDSRNRRQRGI
jgi:hypothetical protein